MAPKRLGGSRRSYNPITGVYNAFVVSENAPIVRSVTAFGNLPSNHQTQINMSRNTNTNRTSRPSSVHPTTSSIYSHSSQPSIPLSPLSASQQQPVYINPDPSTHHRSAAAPSHRRPSSTAFFRPLAPSAAYSTASINPFGSVPAAGSAWEITRPPRPGSGRSSVGSGYDSQRSQRSTSINGSGSSNGKDKGRDKDKGKGKSKKPSSSSCLKVDKDSLSAAAKMGIWLMGTTPRKLEKAARAQKDRREWEREEKRARRGARRGGGRGGRSEDGGEEEEGGVEVWEEGEGREEWEGEEEVEERRASLRSMV
ncbi:hypothetical protein NEMBOFW57_009068 [Staphylotrichum longicolle]|uniref:Uncharacterized protein n=1 Tax=Staphylotrichum longicolle TaxID=669026 RepID=A0AAD4ESJ2_9PEZI|nr:hypothetical protein NEMBOFW57_009068 [Staphylotrichum longicolle]